MGSVIVAFLAFLLKCILVFRQFDVLQFPEGGDFEAENCLQALNPACAGHKASINHVIRH